jgi:hypothetical protein
MVGLTFSKSTLTTLAAGTTNSTITASYTITQADIDAGKVTNSALATAKDPAGVNLSDISGTATTNDLPTEVIVDQKSSIAVVKTASVDGNAGLGDTITYTFAITNTGTTTLNSISVTDPMVGLVLSGNAIATLAPGQTNLSISGTYTITQDDVNAGKVTNSAIVNGKNPQGSGVSDVSGTTISNNDPTETPIGQRATIALVKTASVSGSGAVGDIITYSFQVKNTGTTTLTAISISDDMVGLVFSGNAISSLEPGELMLLFRQLTLRVILFRQI